MQPKLSRKKIACFKVSMSDWANLTQRNCASGLGSAFIARDREAVPTYLCALFPGARSWRGVDEARGPAAVARLLRRGHPGDALQGEQSISKPPSAPRSLAVRVLFWAVPSLFWGCLNTVKFSGKLLVVLTWFVYCSPCFASAYIA